MNFITRLIWAWRVIVSSVVIVVDDKGMVVNVPLDDTEALNDIVELTLQQGTMDMAIKRMQEARNIHKHELDLLVRRLGQNAEAKTPRKKSR